MCIRDSFTLFPDLAGCLLLALCSKCERVCAEVWPCVCVCADEPPSTDDVEMWRRREKEKKRTPGSLTPCRPPLRANRPRAPESLHGLLSIFASFRKEVGILSSANTRAAPATSRLEDATRLSVTSQRVAASWPPGSEIRTTSHLLSGTSAEGKEGHSCLGQKKGKPGARPLQDLVTSALRGVWTGQDSSQGVGKRKNAEHQVCGCW